MIPISTLPALDEMSLAEKQIREALAGKTVGEAMSGLLDLYRRTPAEQREALVAVLATRVALQRPNTV